MLYMKSTVCTSSEAILLSITLVNRNQIYCDLRYTFTSKNTLYKRQSIHLSRDTQMD